MTGAQHAEGALTVARLTHKLTAEGVKRIIICADDPKRHDKRALAKGAVVWHRDRLDEAQRILRDVPGVANWYLPAFGAAVVLLMVWLPDGLLSIPDRLKARREAREASALRAATAAATRQEAVQ